MRTRFLPLIASAFVFQHCPAATLQSGEWFIDSDPGEGQGTEIAEIATQATNRDFDIPAAVIQGLDDGPHLLGVRFQDTNGGWSQVVWRTFVNTFSNGPLAKGEWFFNEDPGEDEGTSLTGVAGQGHSQDHTIPLTGLPAGANLLGLRFQDQSGGWGQPVYRVFLNPDARAKGLNRVEYAIHQSGSVISSGSILADGSLAIDLQPTPEDYTPVAGDTPLLLEVQVVDESGRRSHKVFQPFTVASFTQTFLDRFFTPAEQADPQIAGTTADPDRDGLSNLLEQAFGLDPRATEPSPATPTITGPPAALTFQYQTALPPTLDPETNQFTVGDLNLEIQVSKDVTTWSTATTPADFTITTAPAPNSDGTYQNAVNLNTNADPGKFYRLMVRRP